MDTLHAHAMSLSVEASSLLSKVRETKKETIPLLSQIRNLNRKLERLDEKEKETQEFIEKYTISPQDEKALRETVHIDDTFFRALERVKEVHELAKDLFVKSMANKTAIEIMESASILYELAIERLYRWMLSCLRMFSLDSVDVSTLQTALSIIQKQKEDLLSNCLEEYGTVRRGIIVRDFIKHDHHQNDPIKYTSEILSWISQGVTSEHEYIKCILKLCENTTDLEKSTLSFISEGLVTPAKPRLEGILLTHPSKKTSSDPVIIYQIRGFFTYYFKKLEDLLPNESPLLFCLKEIASLSDSLFSRALSSWTNELSKYDLPTADLRPTDYFMQNVNQVQRLLSHCLASPSITESDIVMIRDQLFPALLSSCRETSRKIPNEANQYIFHLNCLDTVASLVESVEWLSDIRKGIILEEEVLIEQLSSEQTSFITSFLGMSALYSSVIDGDSQQLSTIDGCDSLSVTAFANSLDAFLASPGPGLIPTVQECLLNPRIQDKINYESKSLFVSAYTKVYEAVSDDRNQYDTQISSLLPRNPQQVKALLL